MGDNWQPIMSAPEGEQIIVWDEMYGWLLALQDRRFGTGWTIKSSGNFYAEMPMSVVQSLRFWQPVPKPPNGAEERRP